MRCWKCKSEMPEGLKYCGNCGVHMNRAVYLFQWLFSKKGLPVVIGVLVLALVATGVLIGTLFRDNIPGESTETTEETEETWVTMPDADVYYEERSEIISVIDANESKDIQTEAEVCEELHSRGFTQYDVSSEYNMQGDYSSEIEIVDTSSEKHPMYETYYFTSAGEIWTIFTINGVTMANPVSYNLQSGLTVQVIVAETDTIMSYDSTTNRFYETIPARSALIVVTVERIDADTLETLTVEEIDKYVN